MFVDGFIPLKRIRPMIQENIFASKKLFWLNSWLWHSIDWIYRLYFTDADFTSVTTEPWFLCVSIFYLLNGTSIAVGIFLSNAWVRNLFGASSLPFLFIIRYGSIPWILIIFLRGLPIMMDLSTAVYMLLIRYMDRSSPSRT